VALEPANVAMRLLVLLRAAQDQGVDLSTATNATFDTLKVTTPDGNAHNLKTLLFGSTDNYGSVLTQTYPGQWTVSYPIYSYGSDYSGYVDNYVKEGDIYITTGGSMLDESGAVWTLSTPETTASNKFAVIVPTASYTYEVANALSNYTITAIDSNQWEISADNVQSSDINNMDDSGNPVNIANWTFDYMLTATPADNPSSTFNRMYGATYTLSGNGGGTSFSALVDYYSFGYAVPDGNPLLYRPSCGTAPISVSGEEDCTLDDVQGVLSGSYPSKTVRVVFTETAPCVSIATIYYNGSSQTFKNSSSN